MAETTGKIAVSAPGKAAGVYTIAAYLRISQEDDRKDESCSIANQRALIQNYVAGISEFKGAKLIDYIDDGISGSRSDRREYQRLLADVRRGAVDCICVKDLSRIGRAMLEVDDLLMNYLVLWGVRFISINDNYDSLLHPLSNLELAVINLANQHYGRDLAQKSMSAKLVKMKRGECLSMPPFGYKKSDMEKNKLVIDPEAAEYVRLIYSLAVNGQRTTQIAQTLNERGIPSPSVYKIEHGHKNVWTQRIDDAYCFWTSGVVRKLIMNEAYLGKMVSNRFKVAEFGSKKTVPRPKEEWIVVLDAHEPLVSEPDFRKAQAVLPKKRCYGNPEHIFGNKVKCPACGHAMTRYTRSNPRFKCGTAKLTDHYGCGAHTILQSEIEAIVLESIRAYASAAIDREELKLAAIQKEKLSAAEIEARIREGQKAVDTLEASITKSFTLFASSKIDKDAFLRKKNATNEAIARKREAMAELGEKLAAITEGRAAAESAIGELTPLTALEELSRELVELLIDRILVHSETEIEIVWAGRF